MGESFLDFTSESLDDAIEPRAAEEGEYTVQLTDWMTDKKGSVVQTDKNDHPYIMPIMEIIESKEAEYAKPFSIFMRIPHEDMNSKDKNAAKWAIKIFCKCFGIDYTQRIDYEDCVGKTGEVLLIVTPDEGYGEQNKVKKFLNAR